MYVACICGACVTYVQALRNLNSLYILLLQWSLEHDTCVVQGSLFHYVCISCGILPYTYVTRRERTIRIGNIVAQWI